MIKCTACHVTKEDQMFDLKKDGNRYKNCIKCKEYLKEYYKKNKSKILVQAKQSYTLKPKEWKEKKIKRLLIKQQIGVSIKEEVLKLPTNNSKKLWSGRGLWSKYYDRCSECTLTMYKHKGNGVCIKCYEKIRYDMRQDQVKEQLEKLRKENPEKYKEINRENASKRRSETQKFMEMIKHDPSLKTPKINNLLKILNEL